MIGLKELLMAACLLLLASCCMGVEKPNLLPWPKNVTIGNGAITLPKRITIFAPSKEAAQVASTFAADLKESGFTASVIDKPKAANITLDLIKDDSLGEEGYKISIDSGIRIAAPTETGLFWGTRTLLQILSNGPDKNIPKLTIWDKPELKYRALMVDPARNFHSIEFHKKMVKTLAACKMNYYHIHFTDHQSYTLPSESYPDLPTKGRHYTKDQLTELVRLAEDYHVTIVPELDCPGHAGAMVDAIPEFTCQGKGRIGVICPSSEKSIKVLETLLTEVMDIFPGPYVHIGADEVDSSNWTGCPDCEALKVKEGLADNHALYKHFINRMNRFIKDKGRRMIVWEGFSPSHEPKIDKDVIVEQFENAYAQAREYIAAGHDLINASWSPLYVVRNISNSTEDLARWNPLYFGRFIPPKLQKLDEMVKIEPTKQLIGVSICSWENIEAGEEPMLLGIGQSPEGYSAPQPRLLVVAERAWSGGATDAQDLLRRVQSK